MSAIQFVEARQRERAAGAARKFKRKPQHGRKLLAVWVDPRVIRQLKIIAAEEMRQQQEIMAEALNSIFAKYGKEPIA
jgi:hypothetical protein